MTRSTRPALNRLVRPLLVTALALGAVVALQAPSHAVAVTTIGELQTGLATCTGTPAAPYTVVLGSGISDAAAEVSVSCDARIDLNSHDLTVRNILIETGRSLEVTDTTPAAGGADPNANAGTLTADASGTDFVAAIRTTAASLTISGTAAVVATAGPYAAGIGSVTYDASGVLRTEDTSTVVATGGEGGAGIGGGPNGEGGTTTADDHSSITATGGAFAAGIGGGHLGIEGGTTTANDDSTITATGGAGGAGIGGGPQGAGGTTTSNGSSTITATGGQYGAGIGGGRFRPGGATASNDDSSITATGGQYGAGIGGGDGGNGGLTNSYDDSTMTAIGGEGAAGIGGGRNGSGAITNSNDTSIMTATGSQDAAGVGGGSGGEGGTTAVYGSSRMVATSGGGTGVPAVGPGLAGLVSSGNYLTVNGTLELGSDLVVSSLFVAGSSPAVIVNPGGVITRRTDPASSAKVKGIGDILNNGAITLPTVAVFSTLSITGRHYQVTFDTHGGSPAPDPVTVFADTFAHGERTFPPDPTKAGVEFLGWNTAADGTGTAVTATTPLPGTSTDGAAHPVTVHAIYGQPGSNLTDLDYALAHCTSTPAAPYQVALTADLTDPATELNIDCDAVIDLAGHDLTVRNVIIATGKELEVTDTTPVAPGPDPNADAGTLTADATSADDTAGIQNTDAALTTSGTATIVAQGGPYGAGIGGDGHGAGGTTTTNDSSTVTATGGAFAAGIGGGAISGVGGTTTTNGTSTVAATGGAFAAGIGGGNLQSGGTTTSNDSSTITATGGASGAGIGGGSSGAGGSTTSNDSSTITVTGGDSGAGIGGGYGGNGGSTTSNDTSVITANGGRLGAAIGGGYDAAGGSTTAAGTSTITAIGGRFGAGLGGGREGDGSGTTAITEGATIVATAGEDASAIGVGSIGTPGTGTFLTITSGTLLLGSDLKVPDATGGPEVSIGAGGLIARRTSPASTAVITGDGMVENSGAITLPTDAVAPTPVSNRHHRVTFDTQGGSTAPDPVTVYADTFARGDRTFPPDPTRNGYVFAGWNTTGDGSGDAITATTALPGSSNDGNAHPVTLYAQWLDPTSNLTGLKAALASCTGTPAAPYLVALTTDLANPATELVVNCDARIDLHTHDLTVRNVIVAAGTSLEVTDTTPVAPGPDPNADAGTLTTDASAAADTAGIQTTGATLTTSGTAEVVALGGYGSAGIGGGSFGDGGTTNSTDTSAIRATGGAEGAGIGGGSFGDGGTTVAAEDSMITASGGSGAAGIGGGFGGDGASTTVTGHSAITATGGQYAAGIGGGATFAGGGAGAGTTDIGGGTSVTATSGGGASAIGIGDGGTPLPGTFLTVDGTLRLGSDLWIPNRAGSPEVSIGTGGLIARRTSPASAAAIIGAGTIANSGAITLPTAAVAPTLVTDRHYLVSFDARGGAPTPADVTVYADTFTHGDRVLPAGPTKFGFVFLGWSTTPSGPGHIITTTTVLPGTSLNGTGVPVTLYARYALPPFDVTGLHPTITGTAQVGQTLHADPGPISPASADLAYQWNADGTPIPGATQPERGLNPDFEGALITVTITATAPGYQPATATSDPVGPVAPDDDPPLVCITQPTVTGDRWYDAVLTTTSGSWTGEPPDFSYQWLRDGDPIDGADATSYRTTLADIGHDLSVVVTATRPPSTPGTAIAEAGTITTAPLTWASPTTLKIKGTPKPGKKLRANLSQTQLLTGTDPDATQVTYQWLRDGTTIKKATKPTYQVKNRDKRHRITLTVTLTKTGHTPLTLKTKAVRVKK